MSSHNDLPSGGGDSEEGREDLEGNELLAVSIREEV